MRSKRGTGRSSVDFSEIADVDPAESFDRSCHRSLDRVGVAHVADEWQGLAAGRSDLRGGAVDGAGQPRVGRRGLGKQRDIRAASCGCDCDGQPYTARPAGYEKSPSLQRAVTHQTHAKRRALSSRNCAKVRADLPVSRGTASPPLPELRSRINLVRTVLTLHASVGIHRVQPASDPDAAKAARQQTRGLQPSSARTDLGQRRSRTRRRRKLISRAHPRPRVVLPE
jgi:hypothetical protein